MTERRFFMLQVKRGGEFSASYTMTEVATHAGVHPELLERFVRLGLIEFRETTGNGEWLFGPDVIPAIRRILRLRNDLGVNYAGVGVILELLSRVEALESRVRELEHARSCESSITIE